MTQSIDAMIAAAVALLGTGETNGDNVNIVTEWYGENGEPWCDMGITYEAYHSGNQAAVCFNEYHDYTVEHAQAFYDHGQWHTDVAGIAPGDIVFFDWDGSNSISAIDHVGLVEYVDADGVHTIECNIDNLCARKVRHSDYIVGYGRPAYAPDPVDSPPPSSPPPPTSGGATYTVQAGDTLSSIAAAQNVDGGWQALYDANKDVIGPDPDAIDVGMVLTVPGASAPPPATLPSDPPPPPPSDPPLPWASYRQIHAAAILSTGVAGALHGSNNSKPSVLLFQKGLAQLVGLDYSSAPGVFGPRTHDATAKFQRLQGWTGSDADGVPGPVTTTLVASRSGLFQVDDF